jgi:hypothetical protein
VHVRPSDQLRDHSGQKARRREARYWLVLEVKVKVKGVKGNNTRRPRPLFFSACVGMVLVNNISARKISRCEVGGPAQRLQAAVEQLTGGHFTPTPTLDFFRAISAGECLVVSTVTLCGAKPNSLTPLGSVGLPLLKITL